MATKDRIWAFFGVGKDESLVAVYDVHSRSWMPLITTNEAKLPLFRRVAQQVASETGKTIECVRFKVPRVVETIRPETRVSPTVPEDVEEALAEVSAALFGDLVNRAKPSN